MKERKHRNGDSRESTTKCEKGSSGTRRSRNTGGRNNRESKRFNDRDTNSRSMVNNEVKPANDVTWYTKSMEQVLNSANISFMDALGKLFVPYDTTAANVTKDDIAAPGVMRIGYVPTFGNPVYADDAMNVAANKTYAWIRYYNSGSRNYDAPDYMKYLAAMDTAFAFAGYLIRIYGLANSYSSVNRYWPETFFQAMNVDFNSIKANLANFRTYINNFISKVNSLAVPTSLPIFARHFWMCSNVYKDGDSLWAQCYIQVPEVYGLYDISTGDISYLLLHKENSAALNLADLMRIGDLITSSLMSTQDFYIMSGDTIKAFGDNVFRVNGIAADYVLYPVYDPGVLNQIMSSFAMGDVLTKTSSGYSLPTQNGYVYSLMEDTSRGCLRLGYNDNGTQLPGNLSFAVPQASNLYSGAETVLQGRMRHMVNLTVNDVSPLHVIESTRANAIPNVGPTAGCRLITGIYSGDATPVWDLKSCGADVYTTFQVFFNADNGLGGIMRDYTKRYCSVFSVTNNTPHVKTIMRLLSAFESFDWHPILYPLLNESTAAHFFTPHVDVYRAAIVDTDVLERIHNVANLSLFDVTLQNSLHV